MLNAFALVVICALALLGALLVIKLGTWPKRAAEERRHPYAEAINVLSWGGLILTGGLGWLGALVWAYAPPGGTGIEGPDRELESRLTAEKA